MINHLTSLKFKNVTESDVLNKELYASLTIINQEKVDVQGIELRDTPQGDDFQSELNLEKVDWEEIQEKFDENDSYPSFMNIYLYLNRTKMIENAKDYSDKSATI